MLVKDETTSCVYLWCWKKWFVCNGCFERYGNRNCCDLRQKKRYFLEGMRIVSLNEFEKLDSETVCIVTPTVGAESVKERLEKHFAIVVGMEIFIYRNYCLPPTTKEWGYECCFPFNHYESPYISEDSREFSYYKKNIEKKPLGVNLNENGQFHLWKKLSPFYDDFYKDIGLFFNRYHPNNDMFGEADATLYYSMLRLFKPERVIEIGSGHSTALLIDVKEKYLQNTEIVCIEPYPERLTPDMTGKIELHKKYVQEVDVTIYDELRGVIFFL